MELWFQCNIKKTNNIWRTTSIWKPCKPFCNSRLYTVKIKVYINYPNFGFVFLITQSTAVPATTGKHRQLCQHWVWNNIPTTLVDKISFLNCCVNSGEVIWGQKSSWVKASKSSGSKSSPRTGQQVATKIYIGTLAVYFLAINILISAIQLRYKDIITSLRFASAHLQLHPNSQWVEPTITIAGLTRYTTQVC